MADETALDVSQIQGNVGLTDRAVLAVGVVNDFAVQHGDPDGTNVPRALALIAAGTAGLS